MSIGARRVLIAKNAAEFRRNIIKFGEFNRRQFEFILNETRDLTFESIRDGSSITGAPGQPVDTWNLYNSWRKEGGASTGEWRVYPDLEQAPYAPIIENNSMGHTLRSKVGGWHSVKITRLNFRLIIAAAARRAQEEITF